MPPLVTFLAKSPLVLQYDLSSVKIVKSGAAPLSADVMNEFKSRVPVDRIGQGENLVKCIIYQRFFGFTGW